MIINSIINEFALGQTNVFVMLFILLSYIFVSKGKNWAAAFVYSLSMIKVVPIILLPYFIFNKRWNFIFKSFIIMVIFNLIFVLIFGYHRSTELLNSYSASISKDKISLEGITFGMNQSLWSASARLSERIIEFNSFKVYLYQIISFIIGILLFIPSVLKSKIFHMNLDFNDYSLFICIMLLLSPDTRRFHLVFLLIPIFTILSQIYSKNFRRIVIFSLFLVFVVISQGIIGRGNYEILRHYSIQTIGMLFLAFLNIYIIITQMLKKKTEGLVFPQEVLFK